MRSLYGLGYAGSHAAWANLIGDRKLRPIETRAVKICSRHAIYPWGVARYTDSELLRLRNMGRAAVQAIRELVAGIEGPSPGSLTDAEYREALEALIFS